MTALHKMFEEWKYRRDERLAILCPEGAPTPAQIKLSECEADEAVRLLTESEKEQPEFKL